MKSINRVAAAGVLAATILLPGTAWAKSTITCTGTTSSEVRGCENLAEDLKADGWDCKEITGGQQCTSARHAPSRPNLPIASPSQGDV